MLKLPVLAPQVLQADGIANEFLQVFLALRGVLPQQLAAALGDLGGGVLAARPQAAQLPQAATKARPPGDAGLLPREHLGKLPHLVQGVLRFHVRAGIRHELGHAAQKHLPLAAALRQLVVQQGQRACMS